VIKDFNGVWPKVHPETFQAEGAQVIGDVTMGQYSSIWCNAVARGDVNKIIIGDYTNVQDCSVLHVADNCECVVGSFVTVGHGAIIHGARVGNHCLIGMGAILLNNVEIGEGSIVAAGTLVPEGKKIPPRSLVIGSPGKVVRELGEDSLAMIHAQALKYKDLWSIRYGIRPAIGGERYQGEKIV
jgi:carbonic anhydrase/acetyltransferase-like protein (isoleucine patch superfamily)